MTTKELYIKHKAGEVSNQKFLYEVRRDSNLPWITNMTSYEDAVKILKNKGIISEADEKKYGDVEIISKTIDMVNPYEYSKGMNYELDMADNPVRQDLTQDEVLAAQKIVLKNITKDSNYYTKLCAGLKPTAEVEGYKEINIAGKNLEKGIKADMKDRNADGNLKKELKKDAKSNVKDNLGDSEKAPKKPKGVEEFKDKGVTGSFKTIKEGIEEIIREKLAKKKADEAKIKEAQIKVGDIVIPNKGEHKGQKHKVIHVFDDGSMNIQPIGLKAKNIKYRQGAIKAKPEDIEEELKKNNLVDIFAKVEESPKPKADIYGEDPNLDVWYDKDIPGQGMTETEEAQKEHHNDPDFPIVKGLYELLDAIVADWGKEDLYHEVEDVVVAYINPDDMAASKEAIKKIKDVLGNYDVLEDYAKLVNGIAVKEPGTGFRPGVDLGASFEKFKSALKEKLKADLKEKKNKSLEEGALDDQIAAAEKEVAQKKKELADAEKKVADIKAKEASAEAQG